METTKVIKETRSEKRRRFILNGNLWKVMLGLTVPLAIFTIFNYAGDLFEMYIASFIGTKEFSSVIFIDQIRQTISAFGTGIAAAGIVLVGRHYGAGRHKEARQSAGNAFVLTLIVSITALLVMLVFGKFLLTALNAPSTDAATMGYFNIQMLSTSLIAINTVFLGLEKSKGNTTFVLVINAVGMVIRVGLAALFVLVFKKGMFEMALATLIAQGIITITGIVFMLNKRNPLQIKIKEFRFRKDLILPILSIGLPIFAGRFIFNVGKVIVNSLSITYYGATAMAALGIALKVVGGAAQVGSSFEETETAVISQNIGNKNLKRAVKSVWVAITYVSITAFISISIIILLQNRIIQILPQDKSLSPAELETYFDMVRVFIKWEKYSAFSSAMIAVFSGAFNGFRKTRFTFLINVFRLYVFRIPLLLIFKATINSYETLGYVMFISNLGTFLVAATLYLFQYCSIKKYGYGELTLEGPTQNH